MGSKKQRGWGNRNTVVGGGGPQDISKKREKRRGELLKNDNWKDRKEKKEELQEARVERVYGMLTELVERDVDFDFNREDEILTYRSASYGCGVSVDSNLVVSGEPFDLEEENAGRDLARFLGSADRKLGEDEAYEMLARIITGHANLRFNRERRILNYGGNNYRCRVSEDSELVVQIYEDSRSFDLRKRVSGKDLIRFLNSKRNREDDK